MEEHYKSMEQVAAGLAHEVKNPLSIVRANIDLLELTDSEFSHKKSYKIMRREIDKVNDLILDFIQYAKPQAIDLKEISLDKIIRGIAEEISALGVETEVSLSGENFLIMGDENKISRVFLNIIKNAAESIQNCRKQEKGLIEIDIKNEESFVRVSVEDNGAGISQEEGRKVSTPFFTTKKSGSGLGLFVSKAIIAEHQGSFSITGEKGKVCIVDVTFPAARTHRTESAGT